MKSPSRSSPDSTDTSTDDEIDNDNEYATASSRRIREIGHSTFFNMKMPSTSSVPDVNLSELSGGGQSTRSVPKNDNEYATASSRRVPEIDRSLPLIRCSSPESSSNGLEDGGPSTSSVPESSSNGIEDGGPSTSSVPESSSNRLEDGGPSTTTVPEVNLSEHLSGGGESTGSVPKYYGESDTTSSSSPPRYTPLSISDLKPMNYITLSKMMENVTVSCRQPENSLRNYATNQPQPDTQMSPPTGSPAVSSPDTDSETETSSDGDEARAGNSRKRKPQTRAGTDRERGGQARTATGRKRGRPRSPREK